MLECKNSVDQNVLNRRPFYFGPSRVSKHLPDTTELIQQVTRYKFKWTVKRMILISLAENSEPYIKATQLPMKFVSMPSKYSASQ